MSEHIVIKKSTLIDIADTIRAKTGLTDPIKISDINTENEEIMSNMNLPDLTNPASASHIFEGKEVIDETGNVIVGEMPRNPGAEHEILIDENGLITSNLVFLEDGYISSGERQIEKQLTTQAAKTITPSTSNQIAVEKNVYTTGQIIVDAMPTAEQAIPSISVDANGVVTATSVQNEGYVEGGTKTSVEQLATQGAVTVEPSRDTKTVVDAGVYTTGAIVVSAIPDEYQDVSSVTATADDVLSSKQFVDADGNIVTGNIPVVEQAVP